MNKKTLIIGLVIASVLISSGYLLSGRMMVTNPMKEKSKIALTDTPALEAQLLDKQGTSSETALALSGNASTTAMKNSPTTTTKTTIIKTAVKEQTALLADGCFWCVEHDIEKEKGVISAVSGYAGGTTENPTYENYVGGGHREVVFVTYDANTVSFANLVEHIIKHGDPTDASGSFNDRGEQYAPAIYYETDAEKLAARSVIDGIDKLKVFEKPLPLIVIPRVKFWSAEEYHQDYGEKNPVRYGYYRSGSGRDKFIAKYWGAKASDLTVSNALLTTNTSVNSGTASTTKPWLTYVKPSKQALRKELSEITYDVTQEEGTETPHKNLYDKNYAEGIYVDILSGEPLYLSKDKYDSGTGWPSFVKPITDAAVVLRADETLFHSRTEVRSRYSDNHLGHVFYDGPSERGGKRYCMNSAALRFVPKAEMEKEGYGYLLQSL